MMDLFRTPEERFEGLPDFGYEPHDRTGGSCGWRTWMSVRLRRS